MPRSQVRAAVLLAVITFACLAGCQTAGLRFFTLVGLSKQPLAIAVAHENEGSPAENILAGLSPFTRYHLLQEALTRTLDRPVGIEPCFPLQAASGLRSGWYNLAFTTPVDYARFGAADQWSIMVVSEDLAGRVLRSALLVVPARSDITQFDQLRGKSIAFGPAEDARTHYAALLLLAKHGLKPADLALELFPLPGSLRHMPDMRSVAQSVINGSAAAGFIDEAAWDEFPESDQREGEPARDKLRILARTIALPSRLVIAAPKLAPAESERVRAFLLDADKTAPDALRALGIRAYRLPGPEVLEACRALEPVVGGQPPSTQPAVVEPNEE